MMGFFFSSSLDTDCLLCSQKVFGCFLFLFFVQDEIPQLFLFYFVGGVLRVPSWLGRYTTAGTLARFLCLLSLDVRCLEKEGFVYSLMTLFIWCY